MIDIIHFTGRRSVRLALVAMLTTFTGCEIGLHVDGLYGEGSDEGDGGDENPNMCFADFDGCMADAGEDPEAITACHDTLLACLGGQDGGDGIPPDPDMGESGYESGEGGDGPIDFCEQALQDCLENSPDPAICIEEYELCTGGGGEGTGGESTGGSDCDPPPVDICEEQLQICLENSPDPDACFQEYELCIGGEPPPPPPPDECEAILDMCLQGNPDDPEACFLEFEACLGGEEPPPPPPSDCELELDVCLQENPDMPELCFMNFEACIGEPPPPSDCQLEFELCVQNAYTDEDLLLCEEQLMLCEQD
ncbi:MAG: hypothetical protein KC431_23990 [Myxococcales bacterium]|nr:hypothetical protein [Myxococcales bacterium]